VIDIETYVLHSANVPESTLFVSWSCIIVPVPEDPEDSEAMNGAVLLMLLFSTVVLSYDANTASPQGRLYYCSHYVCINSFYTV